MPLTIAFDTETTGLDQYHSARPFFVTMCIDKGDESDWDIKYWEWHVDPKTRIPSIPEKHLHEVRTYLDSADVLVGQNLKFDITGLEALGVYEGRKDVKAIKPGKFPWHKIEDTLVAGHMLYSARKHDLTSMVTQYLNDDPEESHDIKPYEDALFKACEKARRECRKRSFIEKYGGWNIAKKGKKGMPSAKEKCWKYDTWLPLAVAMECEYPPDHPWYTVLEEYANNDSQYTLALWYEMKRRILSRKLWKIYRCRMDVIPVGQRMERASVTGSITRTKTHKENFKTWRAIHIEKCTDIAEEYGIDLKLPDSGTTKQLSSFVFDTLRCPVIKYGKQPKDPTKKIQASLDKEVLEYLVKTAQPGHQTDFLTALQNKRKCDTALQYIEGYSRFWIPSGRFKNGPNGEEQLYFRMHPFLNPTGTVQLRWSSSNPNEQNISKQEGYNLRYCFGPEPDREWWSLDYQNLELRIPTFESKEPALMAVFLKPKDPPYFGSYHLVVFDALHPEIFKEHGAGLKDKAPFDSTWYQWVKNGNFAMIYGCGKRKADATYKVPGAFEIVRDRFPNIARLSDKQLSDARRYGYVQTIPDNTVDPERGFPIMASRTDSGDVLPTTPLNYHVSGTACWATAKAMIRSQKQLDLWEKAEVWKREYGKKTEPAHIKLQVHDELVFDFPKSKVSPKVDLEAEKENGGYLGPFDYKSNLGYIRVLQKEMEKSGQDLSMPLPVGVEYNETSWGEITLKC